MRILEGPDNWRKPSRSQNGNNCVEVALNADEARVRDTKDRAAGYLSVSGEAWTALLHTITAK